MSSSAMDYPMSNKYVQPSIVDNQLSSVGDRIYNDGRCGSKLLKEGGIPLWSMVIIASV